MAPQPEPSTVKLCWKDPQRQASIMIWQGRTEPMQAQEDDMSKLPILPYFSKTFKENDILALHVITDATDGLDISDSKVRIPVTFRNTRTGAVYEALLTPKDMTFKADGTTFTSGVEQEWGYYQVPLGLELKLGQKNAFNSRVLISPYDDTT